MKPSTKPSTKTPAGPGPLVYRRDQVLDLFGISKSTLQRWMAREDFPRPLRLGPRAVGWSAAQCQTWLAQRPQATSRSTAK